MALKTIHSSNITFMDTTDDRKLNVYISSNHPTVQLYNSNTKVYTPDWSITNLQLSAEIYLDSKEVTSDEQTVIGWYMKVGTTETLVGSGTSITIATNTLATNPIITYICKAEYQSIDALSQLTFTRTDTGTNGQDGTGVEILGTYESLEILQEAHPTGNPGETYIVGGDLYVWAADSSSWENVGRIQGPAGESAKSIVLSGSAQVFTVSKTNIYMPDIITVTAQRINIATTEDLTWSYSKNGGIVFIKDITQFDGVSRNGDVVTVNGSQLTSNSLVIKVSDGTVEDVFTIYKAIDGSDGMQGDSVSMAFLTNENVSFVANSNGQTYGATMTTNVVAFNGTEKVLPTIGTILTAGLPEGITINIDKEATALSDKEVVLMLTVDSDVTLGSALSINGEITIPVISPVSMNLKLSWSKINTGPVGLPGGDAVTFQVYSSNGYALSTNTPTITLQTFAYVGDAEIQAGATYQWYRHNKTNWVAIDGATNSYFDVTSDTVSFSNSYMCKMQFDGMEYVGVVTIDDKNDENKVFTSKPSNYTVGDLWIVGTDYIPGTVELGTLLRAEHTNSSYADTDWITATKYDDKIDALKDNIDIYNQYFSFDQRTGLRISARDANGNPSQFSTTLSNERLSFNQGTEAVAYIESNKLKIKEAEIISPLTVTGQYSGSTMQQAPIINIGNFSIVVESNGSLSIVANT